MVSARSAGICTCSRSPSSFTTSTLWVRGACACVRRGSTGAAGEAEGDERDMGRIYAVPLPKEGHGASESGKSTYCDHHKKAALHQVGAALFDSGTVAGVRTWALTQLRQVPACWVGCWPCPVANGHPPLQWAWQRAGCRRRGRGRCTQRPLQLWRQPPVKAQAAWPMPGYRRWPRTTPAGKIEKIASWCGTSYLRGLARRWCSCSIGCGWVGAALAGNLARLHVVVPKLVVLLGPPLAHVPRPHGLVGAAHAHRAHVDVAADQRHHPDRQGGVDHVGDLHVAAHVTKARNELVEHQAGGHHKDAGYGDAPPEQALLAGVEAVGRNLVVTPQHAAALGQPHSVAPMMGSRKNLPNAMTMPEMANAMNAKALDQCAARSKGVKRSMRRAPVPSGCSCPSGPLTK